MYTPRPTKKTRGAKTQKNMSSTSTDRDPPPLPLIRLTPDSPRFSAIPIKFKKKKKNPKSSNETVEATRIMKERNKSYSESNKRSGQRFEKNPGFTGKQTKTPLPISRRDLTNSSTTATKRKLGIEEEEESMKKEDDDD